MPLAARHIYHLRLRNGAIACRNRAANFSCELAEFRDCPKQCQKCAANLAKMDAITARKVAA